MRVPFSDKNRDQSGPLKKISRMSTVPVEGFCNGRETAGHPSFCRGLLSRQIYTNIPVSRKIFPGEDYFIPLFQEKRGDCHTENLPSGNAVETERGEFPAMFPRKICDTNERNVPPFFFVSHAGR